MKRPLRTILLVMIMSGITTFSLGCTPENNSDPAPENEILTVQRGDLTVDITAVGNLALANTEDLTFDLFYPKGTVGEVLVEEGDTVEEGQVLATVDASEWEEELEALEDKVTAAERALTSSERQLASKQHDLTQAEINLINAEINLETTDSTYSVQDFSVAEADIGSAEDNLKDTLFKWSKYGEGTPGYITFQDIVLQAQARLDTAEAKLEAMLSDFDTREVRIKKLQVDITGGKLEDARLAIDDAQIAIDDARKGVSDAQKELDEALESNPEIVALFDGFVAKVNIDGGDEVMKGTVALELADPARFEADLMVNETDIFQVSLGGEATVQIDALQMITLPAQVTRISPSATIQSGVVNYKVKVEIQSLEAIIQEKREARQENMPDISSGELPPRLQQAIDEGLMTREQAEELITRMQAGDLPRLGSGGQMPFTGEGNQGQQSFSEEGNSSQMMRPENFQLREGLTVTVSIIVDKRTDVLLVPNGAITSQEGQTHVIVISTDGTIEERSIQTGLTDWQYTEVVNGLSEGEQVVISQGTAVSATPTSQQGGIRMPFIPGGGRR
ncbi:efflux RND transporter periplasmic adaptor subunit [Chloroflexota bacterium]